MIIQDKINELEQSELPTTAFTINVTGHAFDVLVSKQYKDKPTSIIREIVSNALDAHIEAKQHRPVEITLPTALAPNLVIKDFGTGISPENIINIYTRLFESTRNRSNEYLGGFGLGCKVPFAYSDQFAVESRWNGTAYTYVMFRNKQNIPTCGLIGTAPTDEPNGLTVTLSINNQDTAQFVEAANRILPWFGAHVTTNLPIPKTETLWECDYGKIVCASSKDLPTLLVQLGHVVYPVPGHVTRDCLQGLTNQYISAYTTPETKTRLVLTMPIGSLQVTPNREDLQIDAQAKIAIIHHITHLKTHLRDYLHNLDIPDLLTATRALTPIHDAITPLGLWPKHVCIQGHELTHIHCLTHPTTWEVTKLERYRSRNRKSKLRRLPTNPQQCAININNPIVALITPEKKRLEYRIQTFLENHPTPYDGYSNYLLIVTDEDHNTVEKTLAPYTLTTTRIVELPDLKPTPKYRAPATPKAALYNYRSSERTVPQTTPFYYVILDRPFKELRYARTALHNLTPHEVNLTLNAFDCTIKKEYRHTLPSPHTWFLASPQQADALAKNPDAVELFSHLKTLAAYTDQAALNERAIQHEINNAMDGHYSMRWYHQFASNVDPNNPLTPERLKRLHRLYPSPDNAVDTDRLTPFGITANPAYAKCRAKAALDLINHYSIFIRHNMSPLDDDVLKLIALYDKPIKTPTPIALPEAA